MPVNTPNPLKYDSTTQVSFRSASIATFKGNSGGLTIIGGTASGDNLTLDSTSNASKGKIELLSDMDFNTLKAVAMVCDNGATLPTSPAPVRGQWFLHTPTGRQILMQYNGTTWTPYASLSTIDMFVDKTNGTDSQDNGGSSGAGAFKTIQFAINNCPSIINGFVTITVAAGTYNESVIIQAKTLQGDIFITIIGEMTDLDGTLTAAASTTGTGATQGTVVRNAGTWTANQRQNKSVRFTSGVNNGVSRLIDSNDTTTLTIVGIWPAEVGVGDTFVVEDWGTIVSGTTSFTVRGSLERVLLKQLKLTGSTGSISCQFGSNVRCVRTWHTTTSIARFSGFIVAGVSFTAIDCGSLVQATIAWQAQELSSLDIRRSKSISATASLVGKNVFIFQTSAVALSGGTILEGPGSTAGIGISVESGSSVNTDNTGPGYVRIRNWYVGIVVRKEGNIDTTQLANNQYSGNGVNEYLIPNIFVKTAATTVNTTVTETDLSSKQLGIVPVVGTTYRVRVAGTLQVTTALATFRYRLKIGGTTIADTGALDPTTTTANVYSGDFIVTVRTAGSTATVQVAGIFSLDDVVVANGRLLLSTNTGSIDLDGTPADILKTTIEFSASAANNEIIEQVGVFEVINA